MINCSLPAATKKPAGTRRWPPRRLSCSQSMTAPALASGGHIAPPLRLVGAPSAGSAAPIGLIAWLFRSRSLAGMIGVRWAVLGPGLQTCSQRTRGAELEEARSPVVHLRSPVPVGIHASFAAPNTVRIPSVSISENWPDASFRICEGSICIAVQAKRLSEQCILLAGSFMASSLSLCRWRRLARCRPPLSALNPANGHA